MRWMTGKPPSVGWYIASPRRQRIDSYRWWNGQFWSMPAYAGNTPAVVLHVSRQRCADVVAALMEWIKIN